MTKDTDTSTDTRTDQTPSVLPLSVMGLMERVEAKAWEGRVKDGTLSRLQIQDVVTQFYGVLSDRGLTDEAIEWMLNNVGAANRLATGEAAVVSRDALDDLTRVLDDVDSVIGRMDSEPLYGRDARIVGVEDGWSGAPSKWEWERLQERAREASTALLADVARE